MFARVMQLFVVSGFPDSPLQPSERVRVRRQLALRRGVALARGRDPRGRAVVIRAENYGELDVVKIVLRHPPQLGVSGAPALVIYMRADHRDEIAARLGRGGVGRETPRPLIEQGGQLAGVSRIDRAGVGHMPAVRRAILRQRPPERAPILAVLDKQRAIQPFHKRPRIVFRKRRPETQRHPRPDFAQIARPIEQRRDWRDPFGNHYHLARQIHRVAQMQKPLPHMLHPHGLDGAQLGQFGKAHVSSLQSPFGLDWIVAPIVGGFAGGRVSECV